MDKSVFPKEKSVNPKVAIMNSYDNLVRQVDIFTEEKLAEITGHEEDLIEDVQTRLIEVVGDAKCCGKNTSAASDPYNICWNEMCEVNPWPDREEEILNAANCKEEYNHEANVYKTTDGTAANKITKRDYINRCRDELLAALEKFQLKAMKHYQAQKSQLNLDESMSLEQVKSRVFSNECMFLMIGKHQDEENNKTYYNLYLVVLDFYLNEQHQSVLRILKPSSTVKSVESIESSDKSRETEATNSNKKITILDKDYLIAILLDIYLVSLFENHVHVKRVINVNKLELLSIEKVKYKSDLNKYLEQINIPDELSLSRVNEASTSSVNTNENLGEWDFSKIKSLIISNEKFIFLSSLSGLSGLESLELKATRISQNSFAMLNNLRRLKLNNCNIINFKLEEADKELPNLEVLSISCVMSSSKLDVAKFERLKSLELTFFNSRNLVNPVIRLNEGLMWLKLNGFASNAYWKNTFATMKLPNLCALSLSSSRVEHFDGAWLCNLPNLKFLHINSCSLEFISFQRIGDGSIFKFVEDSIRKLCLNSFYSASESTTTDVQSKLKYVHIENNNLRSLRANVFSALQRTETLVLTSNQLESVSRSCFRGLDNLKELRLNRNLLKNLHGDVFLDTPHLSLLDLSENNSLALTITSDVFTHLGKCLKKLIIRNSSFLKLHAALFSPLVNLETLDLAYSRTAAVHVNAFVGLDNLLELDLMGTQLLGIKIETMQHFKQLKSLRVGFTFQPDIKNYLTNKIPDLKIS